jgi:hypothetical protein
MTKICAECGAPLPDGGTCHDNFLALLLLEAQVAGGPGELPHFYAVASYALQHPTSFNYTAVALQGLRQSLGEILDGRINLDYLRRRTRQLYNGSTRVTRRTEDAVPDWYNGPWPLSVADVLANGVTDYAAMVQSWAESVRQTLDQQESHAL